MGTAERQQVIHHDRQARDLIFDRLELGRARARALATAQHRGVRADHGQRIAQVMADL
jgi:hypothetical protein